MFASPFGKRRFFSRIRDFAAQLGNIVDRIIPSPFTKWLKRQTSLTDFRHISIPLVRRIYPQLIADKLVAVQPMKEPASLSFYLNYKYSSSKKQKKSDID